MTSQTSVEPITWEELQLRLEERYIDELTPIQTLHMLDVVGASIKAKLLGNWYGTEDALKHHLCRFANGVFVRELRRLGLHHIRANHKNGIAVRVLVGCPVGDAWLNVKAYWHCAVQKGRPKFTFSDVGAEVHATLEGSPFIAASGQSLYRTVRTAIERYERRLESQYQKQRTACELTLDALEGIRPARPASGHDELE